MNGKKPRWRYLDYTVNWPLKRVGGIFRLFTSDLVVFFLIFPKTLFLRFDPEACARVESELLLLRGTSPHVIFGFEVNLNLRGWNCRKYTVVSAAHRRVDCSTGPAHVCSRCARGRAVTSSRGTRRRKHPHTLSILSSFVSYATVQYLQVTYYMKYPIVRCKRPRLPPPKPIFVNTSHVSRTSCKSHVPCPPLTLPLPLEIPATHHLR